LEQCLIWAQRDILKTQKFSKVSNIVNFSFQFSSKLTVENLISCALHNILKSQLDAEMTTSNDCNAEFSECLCRSSADLVGAKILKSQQ